MVKKHRNRPLSDAKLNPNVAAFIPVARRESNTNLNPAAKPFVPTTSAPSSDTVQDPSVSSNGTKPTINKDSLRKNKESDTNSSSSTSAVTPVKTADEVKVKSEIVAVLKEEEEDLSRADTPTSVTSPAPDNDPTKSSSKRAGLTKNQQRKLNRSGKSKSFDTIDLTRSPTSPGSEPQSSGSSSGCSDKKTGKKPKAPAVSPSMESKPPLTIKKSSESEQHVSIVMPLPTLKRKIPDAHIGEGDQPMAVEGTEQAKDKTEAKKYDNLVTENAQLKSQMADFETKWKIHAATLEDLKQAQKKYDLIKNQVQTLEGQLEKKNKAEAEFKKEKLDLKRLLKEKETQLEDQVKLSGSLTTRSKELEGKMQLAEKEKKDLQAKVAKTQAELDNNLSAMYELQALRSQLAEGDVKSKDQQPLMQEVEALKEELKKKEKQGQLAVEQLENLRGKYQKLEEELDGANVVVRRVEALERYNQDMEEQLKVAANSLSEAQSLVADYKAKIESSTQEYLDLLTSNREQENNIQQQLQKNRELTDRLDELNKALHEERQKQAQRTNLRSHTETELLLDAGGLKESSVDPFPDQSSKTVQSDNHLALPMQENGQHEKGVSKEEKRYVSVAHHIVTVEPSLSEQIIEKNLCSADEELQNGPRSPKDSFGMSNFEPRLVVNEKPTVEDFIENGEVSRENLPVVDANASFAEPSADSPLLESKPEVAPTLNGTKNGTAGGALTAVANGTVSPPVRRKRRGCCHIQ
ncbi:hypothetical protein RvY_13017-2 [Ramazzottius varieornatus]|uniref:Uncharacterized protein n=1 Tax=Ramazzottius varieornatus TaxID=947166 RepID=A0A1D1VU04_RAMVA|nr:hypothetical protein RvY_13017-2 [Ramazzottius varieornatus]